MVRAVVFDWDGTLVDSQTAYVTSWKVTLEATGYKPTDDDLEYVIGRAFPDCLTYFSPKLIISPVEFEQKWRIDFRHRVETSLEIFPDAVECARSCNKKNIPIAIATQTPRVEFDRAREISGLSDLTSITVCRTDVTRPKPAPDLYLEACLRLSIAPEMCLAIEDSIVGATSARAAGLTVLGIARSALDFPALEEVTDFTVHSLDPQQLLALCGVDCEHL